VFFGVAQTKVSRDFLKSALLLQGKAEVIEASGSGKNALDFHIAYYLGELVTKDPEARFHVISKDKGFDPLIKHLTGKGVMVRRETDLAEIPALRKDATGSDAEKIRTIVKNLAARGQSRPRKIETLQNTINNLFTKKLADATDHHSCRAGRRCSLEPGARVLVDGVVYVVPNVVESVVNLVAKSFSAVTNIFHTLSQFFPELLQRTLFGACHKRQYDHQH
jgi:hypothetical protein